MFNKAASFMVIAALVPALTGCSVMKTERVSPTRVRISDGRPSGGVLVGITKTDGQVIRFDYGARVKADTVVGVVGGSRQTYMIGEVRELWVFHRDVEKEKWRALGIGVGMLGLGLAVGAVLRGS